MDHRKDRITIHPAATRIISSLGLVLLLVLPLWCAAGAPLPDLPADQLVTFGLWMLQIALYIAMVLIADRWIRWQIGA